LFVSWKVLWVAVGWSRVVLAGVGWGVECDPAMACLRLG